MWKQPYAWDENNIDSFVKNEHEASDEFLFTMMQQNLDHARHVENERLTYCTCITALVAAYLAFFGGSNVTPIIGTVFGIIVHLATAFSFNLNERWSFSFNRHVEYAKGCYYMLHKRIFGSSVNRTEKQEAAPVWYNEKFKLSGSTSTPDASEILPLYSFGINKTVLSEVVVHKVSTAIYFRIYYLALYLVMSLSLMSSIYQIDVMMRNPLQILLIMYVSFVTFRIYLLPFLCWKPRKGKMAVRMFKGVAMMSIAGVVIGVVMWGSYIINGNPGFMNVIPEIVGHLFGGI